MADSVAPLAGLADVVASPVRPAVLDAVDLEILQLLAGDSRMSQRSLARALGMSPPAVGERISRLERAGVIRAYTIDVGWPEVGFPVTVYLTITAVQGHSLAPVIEALRSLPEVADVSLVTGAIDLLARLVVRDHNHLRELLLQRVWQITGVQRTETLVTLAEMHPKRFAIQLLDSMRGQLDGPAHQGGAA
ncbi:MAG TPA: Lrp/AsnC family transcriptional regulator [Candidatus Dormibacteraeota bacterium]|jgi:DNA-binding Lrp family transcriptional regulator|nr:Lrp/AsnC family transcriptional regulator [Candidatus Dormibacteraeota bacterium]